MSHRTDGRLWRTILPHFAYALGLIVFLLVIIPWTLGGCSTVRYPRLLPLTTNERAKFTCEELDNEIADAKKFAATIGFGSVGAEIAAVAGDFGIGNAMERAAAYSSVKERIASCKAAKRERGCPLNAEEEAELARLAEWRAHPAYAFKEWHNRNEPHGSCHTNPECPLSPLSTMERRVGGSGGKPRCQACLTTGVAP